MTIYELTLGEIIQFVIRFLLIPCIHFPATLRLRRAREMGGTVGKLRITNYELTLGEIIQFVIRFLLIPGKRWDRTEISPDACPQALIPKRSPLLCRDRLL